MHAMEAASPCSERGASRSEASPSFIHNGLATRSRASSPLSVSRNVMLKCIGEAGAQESGLEGEYDFKRVEDDLSAEINTPLSRRISWSDSSSSSGSLMSERSLSRQGSAFSSVGSFRLSETSKAASHQSFSKCRPESPFETLSKENQMANANKAIGMKQQQSVRKNSHAVGSTNRPKLIRDLFAAKRADSTTSIGTPASHVGLSMQTEKGYSSAPRPESILKRKSTSIRRGNNTNTQHSVRFKRHGSISSIDSSGELEQQDGDMSCSNALPTTTRKPPSSSSPQKLTKTNFRRLKRELEVQQARLRELTEQNLIRAKDKNLRRMVHTSSSFVFVVFLSTVMYCNYIMLAPHLNAVMMAGLISVVLSTIRVRMTAMLIRWNSAISRAANRRDHVLAGALAILVFSLGVLCFRAPAVELDPTVTPPEVAGAYLLQLGLRSLSKMVVVVSVGALAVGGMEPRSLAASILTVAVLCMIVIPFSVAVIQCAKEAEIATSFLLRLIDSDDALQSYVGNITSSGSYQWLHSQLSNLLGDDVTLLPVPSALNSTHIRGDLKANLRHLAAFAGANMQAFSGNVLSVASNVSNLAWAFTTFSTTLFYLLNSESSWAFFTSVSPLSPDDNAELYESMRMSTIRILLCSITILSLHFCCMYVLLSSSGLEIVAIPSFACGLFAVLPLWGTYVVFVPVSLILWAQGCPVAAVLVISTELFMVFFLDARITSYIPGDSHFVALSIVAGLYSFGFLGFLYGPLLVVLAGTVVRIYVKYLKKPLSYDISSPAVTNGDSRLTGVRRKLF